MGNDRRRKVAPEDQRLGEYSEAMKHTIGWRFLMRALEEKAERWLRQEFREYARNNGGCFTKGQVLLFIRQVVYELANRLTISIEDELAELGCEVEPLFPEEKETPETAK